MILIDDAKYSCLECIRGHRSSQCRHYSKPLLQVRSKGRPNFQINGNPNHRIAVFAEEFVAKEDEDEALSKKEMNSKKKPVVILKASSKHIFDLENGQVVGKYDESEQNNGKDFSMNLPVIKSSNFINTTSCCSKGIVKPKKSCCCNKNVTNGCRNNSDNIAKCRANTLKKQANLINLENINWPEENFGSLDNNGWKREYGYIRENEPDYNKNETAVTNFDSFSGKTEIPNYSAPEFCLCGDNCTCDDCMVHNDNINSDLENLGLPRTYEDREKADKGRLEFPSEMDICYNSRQNKAFNFNTALNDPTKRSENHFEGWNNLTDINENEDALYCDIVKVPLCTVPGSCVCDEHCTCEGCTVHGNATNYHD